MKTIILSSLLLATVSTMPALASKVEVFPLGTNNTLIRVSDPANYLIFPVQESIPDAKIDVIVDGKVDKTIYVRLADSKVDYTVPFDLSPYEGKGEVLLNVVSEADRTHSRDVADYICWEQLQVSDNFDTTNTEKYRPSFHHTPLYGWMNDPNGMFYKDGVWHLYYQYNPYGSKWQNMTWGHSTSKDLINWEHQPLAIEPNALGSIFSGSAVVDHNNTSGLGKDAVVALYTAAGPSQIQSLAYSHDDGKTFNNYNLNPVIPNPTEARDPKVFWHEPSQQWVLVLAHALEKEMQIYTSPNLLNWTLQSSFGKGYGSQGGVWECPDLFELPIAGTDETKWVLLCNINPGAPMGGSGTQYFIGEFDGKTFTPDNGPKVQKWMDYGKDHYATVTWSGAPDNRRTAIGWMSNWQYANDVPTMQFRSANTLPRDLGLFRDDNGEVYLSSVPSPELVGLRSHTKNYGHAAIGSNGKEYSIPALCEIVIDYDALHCDKLNLLLSNKEHERVKMTINVKDRTFKIDRSKSGITNFNAHFAGSTTAPMHRAAKGQLRIFIDNSSIEVFDGEGRFVMTDLVFPEEPYTTLTLDAVGGKAIINDLTVYTLKN